MTPSKNLHYKRFRDLVISSENLLPELEKVLTDAEIKRLWENYRKKFNYAADLEWSEITESLRKLFLSVGTP